MVLGKDLLDIADASGSLWLFHIELFDLNINRFMVDFMKIHFRFFLSLNENELNHDQNRISYQMYFTQNLILCPCKAKIIMRNKRVSVVTTRNRILLLQYGIFAWTRTLNPNMANSSTVYLWQIKAKSQKKMLTS